MLKEFEVTKELSFCAGHRVPNHKSKCRNTHGHGYLVKVTVAGPLITDVACSSEGMVIDFSDIKVALVEEIENRFDHAFIKAESDTLFDKYDFEVIAPGNSVFLLGARLQVDEVGIVQEIIGVPTAETLAYICYKLLAARLNSNLQENSHDTIYRYVKSVQLWETPTSMAEFKFCI